MWKGLRHDVQNKESRDEEEREELDNDWKAIIHHVLLLVDDKLLFVRFAVQASRDQPGPGHHEFVTEPPGV
jgi:hypothetical protein